MVSVLTQLLFVAGIVHLSMPPNPVCHHNKTILRCTIQEDLNTEAAWHIKREGQVFAITNGTDSEVTSEKLETKVTIKNPSKIWAGKSVSPTSFTFHIFSLPAGVK